MSSLHEKQDSGLYDILLMEYATGSLSETLSILVASHVTLSPQGRRHVALYESLGGALMDQCCDPVAMLDHSLNAVLDQLETCAEETACALAEVITHDFGCCLPQPLRQHMEAQACHKKKWRRAQRQSHVLQIPLAGCPSTQAFLIRTAPGQSLPRPRNACREYTLILEGHLQDAAGTHRQGDLLIIETAPHEQSSRPIAADSADCVCLVVADMTCAKTYNWLAEFFPRGFWCR